MTVPKIANTDAEIERCFPVMAELRQHLAAEEFVPLVRMMQGEGYRLAFIEHDENVVAVAGYRIHTTLFMGKNLYVDDLVTADRARSLGYGRAMIDWLRELARNEGCTHLHLDSGTQRHRAHRFYLREGLDIASFHFSQKLSGD